MRFIVTVPRPKFGRRQRSSARASQPSNSSWRPLRQAAISSGKRRDEETRQMKAAVLREIGKPLAIEDVQINKPGPHEVLIRTAAAGVCHSDLHFLEGSYMYPMPVVLGHESAGIVEAVGSEVRTVKVGDHVITCLSAFCGHCEHCLTGYMSRCQSPETKRGKDEAPRLHQGGTPMNQFINLSSFAEQMLIHEHACV